MSNFIHGGGRLYSVNGLSRKSNTFTISASYRAGYIATPICSI